MERLTVFDIKAVEADALKEIAEEKAKAAKAKIKGKLAEIARAKRIVANLEEEYAVLLRDIGSTEV